MKWEFEQWRKQWLNWLIYPVVLVLIIISYSTFLQQKNLQVTIESNRLVKENEFLNESDTDLAKVNQTNHIRRKRQIIKQQQILLHQYSNSFKGNQSNLSAKRLSYYRGMRKYPNFLTELSKKEIHIQILHDEYLVAHHIPADEAHRSLSPGEFLLKFNGSLAFFITLIMLIIHVAGIFTRNFSGNNWRLLYTLPIPRRLIWRQKNVFAFVLMFIDVAYVNIAGYLVSLLLSHCTGGWLYPMNVAKQYIRTRGELIVPVIILMITWGMLVLGVTHIVGVAVKDQFTTTLLVTSFLVIGGIFFRNTDAGLLGLINPLAQTDLGSVFTKIDTIPLIVTVCVTNLIWLLMLKFVTLPIDRRIQLR